jgi:4-hydroxy-3-polyprenylbenzoate decarboxylase
MDSMRQKPYVVAITGASGAIYGLRFVKALVELGKLVALTISEAARIVINEELGIEIKNLNDSRFLDQLFDADTCRKITYYHFRDLTAPIASGSYPTMGMAIVPASTTCFSRIANGISETLVERAAECMIKEGRRLVVLPRETPLSAIHLENLLKLARTGVRIVPAMPAFYAGQKTIDDLVDFVVGRVLDQFELEHTLYRRWTGIVPAIQGQE